MDQLTASRGAGVDPAIAEILERARSLTGDEVVALARAYVEAVDTATTDGFDRRRTLALAKARAADRADEFYALEAQAADAVRDGQPARARQVLSRIDVLDDAERAVADALLSIALRDRLGADVAHALRQPWERVA